MARSTAGGKVNTHPRQVTATSTTGRPTLLLPDARRSYPHGALVPVSIRLQNLTHQFEIFHVACRRANPRVQTLTPGGAVRYPADVPLLAPPPCPRGQLAPALAPGRTETIKTYSLLLGSRLRAVWEYSVGSPPYHRLVTRLLSVTLRPSTSPIASLRTSLPVFLTVRPSAGQHGPLLYAAATECPGVGGAGPQYFESDSGVFEWESARGNRIVPACPNPLRWRVAAGWIGQPAVTVGYAHRQQSTMISHCPPRTICDHALGIAITPAPGVKRADRPGQYPPHWIVLYSPRRSGGLNQYDRLQITSWGTTKSSDDRLAASRGMGRLLRGLKRPSGGWHLQAVRYGGAPGMLAYDLPGGPQGPAAAIILAHHHALYKILAPGTAPLKRDQRQMLASIHFIQRIGSFPPSNG